jgi:protein translocase SecG subunit
MLFGFLTSLWIFLSLILGLLILVQKGKSSMGLGNLGGGAQTLFGGSGGQDLFQKATWVLGTVYIAGSLLLSIMKVQQFQTSRYIKPKAPVSQPLLPPNLPDTQ